MENVISFLASMNDSEIDSMLTFLNEYAKLRMQAKHKNTIPRNVMSKLISKRMQETKPEYETPPEYEKRKREAKWYVQSELL